MQTTFAQLERLEPPNWWADMNLTSVQLLCYGENISDYEVSSKDITIVNVERTENPNYLFVNVNFEGLSAGEYSFKFKKKGSKSFTKAFALKERDANSKERESFNSSDLVYLIMPDRFANGDTSNDSMPSVTEKVNRAEQGGRHGGDLQGVINQLDYLEDLGVTALWSTPLLEDNDAKYSYHTYAQSDVYKIDPRYGTNEDYKRLATEMEQRDMKLIMDYVTNHWGAEHWLIKDLPEQSWIHQFEDNKGKDFPLDGYANSNYRMTTQYDPNASAIDIRYCEDGWFTSTMPDLNQSNPKTLTYLIQNAIWWIEYSGLDGFRVDTYSYNDKEGIANWTKAITDEYPNFNIVGEVWLHNQAQIAYWQKDSKIGALQNFNSHCPSVMDFTLHDAIGVMFKEDNASWNDGMIKAYDNFVNDFLYQDIDNLMVFAENHDTGRINEIYNGSLDHYKLAMTLVATTRGTPQIYYGSEIGMRGDKGKGDGAIRQDFPGGWATDANNAFTKDGRTEEQEAYHSFSKTLFNFRKETPALHTGELLHYLPENNVYVYFRSLEDQTVMVVLNNNPEEQTLDLSRFTEGIKNATTGKELFSQNTLNLDDPLTVKGKSPLVISLN
ncbi:glycoside hydrolase family 13 protein [Croceibacter atlanticus]|jgi:glycosidase|uniref:Putative alpha-amylase n=1 Tax=Croceibacter atlanticus (strain ATCC BAA-628 / JCM 21780 / CIP 108009 / IAM 15332 / KCTC 12090 / HTCC2559) TaxID=216432 RepID=A3U790_CROAH|nr:glycoside hydrolase family 13 protein [Croceibacter atlanticus]EAP88107.1 putative alpha-amylase [Croceibacter atlanticus HTCC2559]